MPVQVWEALLNWGSPWQTNSGNAITLTTTYQTITYQPVSGNDFTLPANWFYPGAAIRFRSRGQLTTTATASTLTLAICSNKSATYGTLASTSITGTTSALTNLQWHLEALSQCRAIGSSGNTMFTDGEFIISTNTTPGIGTANTTTAGLPPSALNTAFAMDTTSAQGFAIQAASGAATSMIIQVDTFTIESID